MNYGFKRFIVASSACLALLGATMQNAAAWTFTASGTIGYGKDNIGLFGAVGADLTGLSFTQVYNVNPAAYVNQSIDTNQAFVTGYNSGTVTQTVTVNGVSQSYDFTGSVNADGYSVLKNFATVGLYGYDQVLQIQSGYTPDGITSVYSFSHLTSLSPALGNSLSFDQSFSGTVAAYNGSNTNSYAQSYFSAQNSETSADTQFSAGGDVTITINQVTAVPEPETYALMLAGLGLVGGIARRRKAKQTA